MDAQEFAAWKAHTARSIYRWNVDEVTWHNRGEFLFYHGGKSGVFLWVYPTGHIQVGTYESAIPHIGDAWYYPVEPRLKVGSNAAEAVSLLINAHGMTSLLESLEGDMLRQVAQARTSDPVGELLAHVLFAWTQFEELSPTVDGDEDLTPVQWLWHVDAQGQRSVAVTVRNGTTWELIARPTMED